MTDRAARTLFGHPIGLAHLAFTEAFERFSFYGMQALLVLYLVNDLLLGDGSHVVGLETLRAAVGAQAMAPQAFASQIVGLYTGFIYLTPLIGGWLGDRWMGRSNAVTAGALMMAAGHGLMAFEQSFVIALFLLVCGGGLLKGNITAQVGGLYQGGDARRTQAFTIFNAFINIGAFVGPLFCGALGEIYGWHYGFGAAGVMMLFAIAVYQSGRRHLPQQPVRPRERTTRARLSSSEWRIVLGLLLVIVLGTAQATAYSQQYNVFSVWAEARLDRTLFGWTVPVTWFQSVDPIATVLLTPVFVSLWAGRGRLWRQGDIGKMAIGSGLCAVAYLILAGCELIAGRAPMALALLYLTLSAVSTFYIWPATLALVSRASPERIVSVMMGVAFLQVSISSFLMGWVGQFYEPLGAGGFWLLQAAISGAGLIATLLCATLLARLLRVDAPASAT